MLQSDTTTVKNVILSDARGVKRHDEVRDSSVRRLSRSPLCPLSVLALFCFRA